MVDHVRTPVKRYNNSFGLELPTVYMSKMVEITKSNEQLQKSEQGIRRKR